MGINDNFGFIWEGYINIPVAGKYTFETVSDDGSRLYFNSFYSPSATSLVNNDGVHAPWPATGTVTVDSAGLYPIAITFFEKDGGENMQVYWTGPTGSGITRQLIPDAAFTTNYSYGLDTIAPAAPVNVKVLSAGHNLISLDWDNLTDNNDVAFYDVYVNGIKKYSTNVSDIIADSLLENTAYTFTVKARDLAGNVSAFSLPVTGTTTNISKGLNYRYYEGSWNNLPDFNALTPVKSGLSPNIDIDVRPSGVNNNFGFVWEGFIKIPVPGIYTFETESDDGSKLYFNSFYSSSATALVDNDGIHAAWPVSAKITIDSAGLYPISFTFFEKDGGETMKVYWTGPAGSGITRQLIPDAAFTDNFNVAADTIAPTIPGNLTIISTGRNIISLDWDNSIDNAAVAFYDVYVNGVKKYSTSVSDIIADSLMPNTSYTFTVRARDLAGNFSIFSNAIAGTTTNSNNGLRYKYYEGTWDKLPDFSALTPTKSGISANIDLSVRLAGVNDHFAFLWEGFINIPVPGTYTFETSSDDGSKLYFNAHYSSANTALVNNDGIHAAWPVAGTVKIDSAGLYPISITFFEKDGGENMQVYWTGPEGSNIPRQPIPDAAFTGSYTPYIDTIPPSMPVNIRKVSATSSSITLDWDDAMDNVGIMRYDVYNNGVKKYVTNSSSVTADNILADRANYFTIVAVDLAGNRSAVSEAFVSSTAPTTDGLNFTYYEGSWDVLPNFDSLSPVRVGTSPNVDISNRPIDRYDKFAFVWQGYIYVPTAGNYTFEIVSDDGSKLQMLAYGDPGPDLVINNDGLHPATSSFGTFNFISSRAHPIIISYFEKDGDEKMEVYWTGPGIPRQLIPSKAFVRTPYYSPWLSNVLNMTERANASTNLEAENISAAKIYPNPFTENFNIAFYNSSAINKISVDVYDLTGRFVFDYKMGNMLPGNNLVNIKVKDGIILPGVYLARLKVNGKVIKTFKLIKAKR